MCRQVGDYHGKNLIMTKYGTKMNVGTDESSLKLRSFNNGKNCGWLKQMRAADKTIIPVNSGHS